MGFIVAVLVMYMTEEQAFWTLVALLAGTKHQPMMKLFTQGMPMLRKCLFQFHELVKVRWQHGGGPGRETMLVGEA